MIFNFLYEININLVGIIYQIMYLMYQINHYRSQKHKKLKN